MYSSYSSRDENVYLLRSSDRVVSLSTDSSTFVLKPQFQLYGKYQVLYAIMYNTFYSVQTGYNDTIYFYENGTNKTATIAPGQYSTSGSNSIATAIASALNAASEGYNTYSVSISAINGLLTVSATNAFQLMFGSNSSNSAAKVMGFTNANTTSGTSATGTLIPFLGGQNSVNIFIQQSTVPSFMTSGTSYGSILIPINVQFNAQQYYHKNDFQQVLTFNQSTNVINVQIRDTNNVPISLNGSEFEIETE